MVLNRLGDKKGTNLSYVVRFNEAMKTTKRQVDKEKNTAVFLNLSADQKKYNYFLQSIIFTIWILCGSLKEVSDRETEKQLETERQRNRETERHRDRETERQRGRETERQRDRETERQRD
jgi:hypothetical protein